MSTPGRLPRFVLIGGQRCASTWVHRCLDEHPEVFVPSIKEVHFFDREFDRGVEWYRSHFAFDGEFKTWGELTPAYLSHEPSARRLHETVPDARLICVLRDPIDRACSAYTLKLRETYPTFAEALDAEPDLLDRGRYAEHLERWLELFDRDQLLVLLYDDLLADDVAFYRRITQFLDVDPDHVPSWIGRTMNTVIMPGLRSRLKQMRLEPAVQLFRRSPLGPAVRRFYRWRRRRGVNRRIDERTRARLREHYEPSIRRLERMLGRDLSSWRDDGS